MPKLAQIFEQSSGTRQVCVSVFFLFWSLYKSNRFHVALFSNRSQRMWNVVKASVTHLLSARVPLLCFYRILTSSVIYYWTDARQHGIYLFLTILFVKLRSPSLWSPPVNCVWNKYPLGGLMEDLLHLQWNPRTVSFVPTKKIVYFLQNNFAEYGHSPLSDRQARFMVLHPSGMS